jgi:ribosomal protein L7Ae-like RNA K-turn-binding protein
MTEPVRETQSAPEREGAHERTCIGCGDIGSPRAMIRLVLGPDGEVAVDARGRGDRSDRGDHGGHALFGRGAHVHPIAACVERAAKAGLPRTFKGKARSMTPAQLGAVIVAALERRAEGLIASARRAKNLVIGTDAVIEASQRGEAKLVIVACDAQAAAELSEVRRAVAEGRAIAWRTKEGLGALGRGGEIAVMAITYAPLASEVRGALEAAFATVSPGRVSRDIVGRHGDRAVMERGA